MAYTKTIWVNNSAPPISADNLNKIETGIFNNAEDCDDLLDGKIDLDTAAAAGTVDGDLYAAITALGWQSDVIV